MRVLRNALVACVLSVAVLGVSGCSNQATDQANKLIDQMNVSVQKSNTLQKQEAQLVDDIGKIDPTTKDVRKATPMLAAAQAALELDKTAVQKVVSLTEQISALDVDSEMKTYVGQQKAIAQLLVQERGITSDLLATLKELYDPNKASKYTQAELDKLTGKVNDLIAQDSALQSRIAEKQGASEQYFKDNLQQ